MLRCSTAVQGMARSTVRVSGLTARATENNEGDAQLYGRTRHEFTHDTAPRAQATAGRHGDERQTSLSDNSPQPHAPQSAIGASGSHHHCTPE